MDKKIFKGVYSAIFSVYDENMNVKKDTVRKLVNYHLDSGNLEINWEDYK